MNDVYIQNQLKILVRIDCFLFFSTGNLFADALVSILQDSCQWDNFSLGVMNGGGIRASLNKGLFILLVLWLLGCGKILGKIIQYLFKHIF